MIGALNAQDKEGRTALHFAVLKDRPQCITLLLQAGANRETKDTQGKTALDLANETRDAELIKLLTQKSAER